MVVTNLDDIAWLFNLRGSDIDYNPVFFAYGVVEPERAIIFTDDKRVTQDAKKLLANDVEFRPYQEIWDYLKNNLKSLVEGKDSKVLIASNASLAVASAFHPVRHVSVVIGIRLLTLSQGPRPSDALALGRP